MAISWVKTIILALTWLGFSPAQGEASSSVGSAVALIRNNINLYSILIDTKDFQALDQVFTPNASLILGDSPDPYPQNLSSIEVFLAKALEGTITLHFSDTQYVEVAPAGDTATALSYGEALYFALDVNTTGSTATVYTTYKDQFVFDGKQWLSESKLIEVVVSSDVYVSTVESTNIILGDGWEYLLDCSNTEEFLDSVSSACFDMVNWQNGRWISSLGLAVGIGDGPLCHMH